MERAQIRGALINARRSAFVGMALSVALLGGCGGDGGRAPTTPAPPPAPTPPPQPTAPAAPANVRVTDRGEHFIQWQWGAVSGAAGYEVQISIGDESFSPPDERALLEASQTAARFEDENLTPGTAVYLRVRAFVGTPAAPVFGAFSAAVGEMTTGGMTTDDHGDSRNTATRVAVDSSTPGVLEVSGDADWFRFDLAPPGGSVIIETTGATDTVGALHLPDGTVHRNDDSPDSSNFRITSTVPGGTYFVEVTGYCEPGTCETGAYVLSVRLDTSAVTSGSGHIDVASASTEFDATATFDALVKEYENLAGRSVSPAERTILRRVSEWAILESFVLGCRNSRTFDELQVTGDALLADPAAGVEDVLAWFDRISTWLSRQECAAFVTNDRIEWTGEQRTVTTPLQSIEAIRVWGTPRTGIPARPTARSSWWIEKDAAIFGTP